jgi:hypothetical protein
LPVTTPTLADKEIAAAVFKQHLDELWANGRPDRLGWERKEISPLQSLIKLPARRLAGEVDPYHILLGAEYYDAAPPTVWVVSPESLQQATKPSRWFPLLENLPPWFNLHTAYDWPGGKKKQLVCFSMNAEFYMTDHAPKESERWKQNRHTVAMTLNRLAEILSPKYYRGPSA